MATSAAAAAAEPQQQKCSGLLLWEAGSGGGGDRCTCVGVASLLAHGDAVDLEEHASGRVMPAGADHLAKLSCFGQSVFVPSTAAPLTGRAATATTPPACVGLELLVYASQAAAQQQQQHAAAGGLPVAARKALHHLNAREQQAEHPAAAGAHLSASAGSAAGAAGRDVELLHHSSSSTPGQQQQQQQQQQPASVLERLQAMHAEVSERLEGQDPWWFAKAFATRAETNVAAIKATVGDVLSAAAADLGLRRRPSDSEPSE